MRQILRTLLFSLTLLPSMLAAQPEGQLSPVESNKRLVERFFRALEEPAPKDLADFFTGNYQLVDVGALRDVRGNKFAETNPDINSRVLALHRALPGFQVKLIQMIAEGNDVFVEAELTGEQKGQLLGIEPTGRPLVMRSFSVYTIADGNISKISELTNLLSMMRQLGYVVLAE